MQMTPHLHQLTLPFTVSTPLGPLPRAVNVFVVIGKRITLIDSGVRGAEEQIGDYLAQIGRGFEEVETLILTHSHPDHVGAARAIRSLTGCRVVAHQAERTWIEDTELQEQQRPVPGFRLLVEGSVPVDQSLRDGERLLPAGGPPLEVLHTPGHSAGSISLWSAEEGVLLTGDAVPVPGDLPIFDDYPAAVASLKRLQARKANLLLSAWDRPHAGDEVQQCLEASLAWLERIRSAACQEAAADPKPDPLALCRRVVLRLGLPPTAANPLVARSFMACL